jgi:uncharacterized protein (TIGR02099 family)
MSPRRRKFLQWLLIGVGTLMVLVALLLTAFGFIVGRVPEYRVQLQDWLNERSGLVVEFRTLRARLQLYGPELVFDDAVLRTPDRTRVLATARRGSVGFDLWESIRTGELSAGRFTLESPEIGLIRTREGRIQLLGQSALPERDAKPFALEQLPTGHFHVEDAVVSFRDEITGRGPWSLSGISFDLTRDHESLRLRGAASLPKALGQKLEFGATAQGPLEEYATLVSTFRLEGEQLDLAGWADVLPDEWPVAETGHGSLRVSGTLSGPALTQLSAEVDFANFATVLPAWTMALPRAEPMRQPAGNEGAQRPDEAVPDESARTAPDGSGIAASNESMPGGEAQQTEQTPPVEPQVLSYERVAFKLRAQKLEQHWNASVTDLELARQRSNWRARQIEAKWLRDGNRVMEVSGKADKIVLENLWPLLSYLPESDRLARLRALDASGTLEDIAIDYRREGFDAAPKYALGGRIHNVAFKPTARAPGFGGLSGELRADEQGGEWKLASNGLSFTLPRLFRDVLMASSVQGALRWQRAAGAQSGWTLGSQELRFVTPDGAATAQLQVTLPGDGSSPLIDLSAQASDLNVAATSKYIPAGRLGAKTVEWFDQAFGGGKVVAAQLTLKGPVRAFPFRRGEGTFLARGQVEDAVFNYQRGWIPATAVAANVEFHNAGMHIRSTAAQVGGLRVASASADIADFKQANLVIQASANGDLREGLQLLKDSPLAPKLGAQFARLDGQGPLSTSVHLELPIRHIADHQVEVTARLSGAGISLQNVNAPVRQLTGQLTVKNALLAAADLSGQWLGGSVEVKVQPQGDSESVLDARGRANGAQLQPLLRLPAAVKLSGATDWHVSAKLVSGGDEAQRDRRTVRIDSKLQGLGVSLPAPLGKGEAEERALQLSLDFIGDDAVLARGSLGEVRSLIRVKRSNEGWALDRGGLRADAVAPALPDHDGLRIEGSIERFVLDDWLALRGSGSSGGKPLSEYLRAANVRVGRFELFGYQWPDVRGVLQATPAGWRVDVNGPAAEGQILIPESFTGAQPLRATLDHLVIAKSEQGGKPSAAGKEQTDPRSFPNLQIYVADLKLGARNIGAVDLKATRVLEGIRFDSASVVGASVRAQGEGEWLIRSDGQHSRLSATVHSSDVAATLRSLGYTEFLQARQGEIRTNISWPGGFGDNMLERASGGLAVDARDGQLVNLQPGAGRVLGLFSVAALPRRLALDFSDLTEKGLAFDTIRGDFELRDGNAYTSNLVLRGPAAEIGIAGRTGFRTRDYDQTAVVTGNLGVSLPVAGALAGGPAIGAALLLFSQVFKEPLKGITRGYYRITGPWDEPVVERVEAAGVKAEVAKDAAAESGREE